MSEIYRFSDLELDSSRFQIRRDGEVLSVQPQVFDVLRYLIDNHDRVVSKDELLEKVWSGRFISEATLSSRIKAVRQLIGDTGKDQSLLKTIRNRGFRYVGEVECELTDARQITSPPTSRATGSPTGIAVLPFEMVGEPGEQSYIGEGVAADIIALLARHHWLKVMARGSSFAFGALRNSPEEIGTALAASQKAVALDPWDAFNRFALGRTLCLMLCYAEAQAELEAAIEESQSFAQAWFALAFCLTVWDKPAEAIPLYEKAVHLTPHDPHIWTFHHMRAMAHFRLGQMDEAETFSRAAVRQQTATYWPFATLCAVLGDLGRKEEAEAIANRLLQMKPDYSPDFARQDFFFMTADDFVDRYLRGTERAGVPRH